MKNTGHGIDPKKNQEIISSIDDIYNSFIEYYNAIVMHGRNQGSTHEENAKNESINKYVGRTLNVFRGITTCCRTQNGTNAMIFLRNLYEIKIYIQYIRHSDISIAQRFFDYNDVAWYLYIKKQKGKKFDSGLVNKEEFEKLKIKNDNFFKKYNGRKDTWSGKSIPEIIATLPEGTKEDEEEDYATVYSFSSFFVHSNIISLGKIMSDQGMYKVDGDIDNIEGSYPLAVKAITKILKIWLEHMKTELPNSIIDLENAIYNKMLSHFSSQ